MGKKRQIQVISNTPAPIPASEEELALASFLFKEDVRTVQQETQDSSTLKAAVWEDSEDERIDLTAKSRTRKLRKTKNESQVSGKEYEQRLRDQFEKVHGRQAWAEKLQAKTVEEVQSDVDSEDETTDEVVAINMKQISDKRLVSFRKIRDVCRVEGSIMTTAMTGNLLAVAAIEKVSVRIFSIGAKGAEQISEIRLGKKFRVRGMKFLDERTLVLVGPQRGVLFWDVQRKAEISYHPSPGGRFEREGWTNVRVQGNFVALSSKQEISIYTYPGMAPVGCGARLNAEVIGFEFIQFVDSSVSLFALDKAGSLYEISTKTGMIIDRKSHSSIFQPLCFATSLGDSGNYFLLVGCGSGVVEAVELRDRKIPADIVSGSSTKSFDRLTTPVETLLGVPGVAAFVSASKATANAIRCGNLNNGHTLAGWPKNTDKFGMIVGGCASENFLVLGTVNGRVLVFRKK
jgi:U3 small nucleolar RNA-associated protein 18